MKKITVDWWLVLVWCEKNIVSWLEKQQTEQSGRKSIATTIKPVSM